MKNELRLDKFTDEQLKRFREEWIKLMLIEARTQPVITGSLDDYLDSLEEDEEECPKRPTAKEMENSLRRMIDKVKNGCTDENRHEEMITDIQGKELI